MNVVSRARYIAKNLMLSAPERIRTAMQNMETTPSVGVIEGIGKTVIEQGRCLILSDITGTGKTVAMYYGFAMQRSLQVERALISRRDDFTEWANVTRPGILAGGRPKESDFVTESSGPLAESGQRAMFKIATRRYEHAVEDPVIPDWDEIEKQSIGGEVLCRIVRGKEIIDSAFSSRGDDWLRKMSEPGKLLGVDDMGTEFIRDSDQSWGLSVWDDFIDFRYRNSMPTIITTNLTADEFVRRYGERITDRIREWGHFIEAGGDNLRKR